MSKACALLADTFLSLEVTTVFQGHVDVRWQGREVKPERGLRIVTQPRQARALGLSWLQLALVWVRAGRRGRVSLCPAFSEPLSSPLPSPSPLHRLQLRGIPFLCPLCSWHPCRLPPPPPPAPKSFWPSPLQPIPPYRAGLAPGLAPVSAPDTRWPALPSAPR